jgi:simple sugar transport system permease protein
MLRIRFVKREKLHPFLRGLIPALCVFLALVFCGVLMLALGFNPFEGYRRLFKGGFGSLHNLSESMVMAIPLIFCALGVSISFTMSLNNIGAEGQFMMGAFAAAYVGLYMPIPHALVLPVMVLAGFAGGGIWAILAILPRALWGVNETIITLMFNYIALLWVDYWVYGPWRAQSSANLPYSERLPEYASMPVIGETRISSVLYIAIAAAIVIYFFFSKTARGYQIRVIGANAKAARYVGMDIVRNTFLVMLFSGGLAGLAGMAQVSGVVGRLQPQMANNAGYTAIIISYLAHFNPFISFVVSFLFGGLRQGRFSLQVLGVPANIITVIEGMILLFVLGGEIFARNKIVVLGRKVEPRRVCVTTAVKAEK